MQLALAEQSQEQVLKLFDELDALTRGPFHAAKAEIDAALARQCGMSVDGLAAVALPRPVLPGVAGHLRRLRRRSTGRSTRSSSSASSTRASACRSTTCWPAATSSRSPASARTPSATDIDREGDVRVLANVVPGQEWLATMLHELGHAAY